MYIYLSITLQTVKDIWESGWSLFNSNSTNQRILFPGGQLHSHQQMTENKWEFIYVCIDLSLTEVSGKTHDF